MSQFDIDTPINPNTKTGSSLAEDLSGTNKWRDALHSLHKGSSRPSYAQAGMLWVDDSGGTVWGIYMYDGTNDILFASFDTVTNAVDLITHDSTDTFTNKTIAFGDNTLTNVASTNTTQTLTNKTIDSANNDLTLDTSDSGTDITIDGTDASTAVSNVTSMRSEGVPTTIVMEIVNIGTWNMNVSGSGNTYVFAHGLTFSADVVSINVFVRSDSPLSEYHVFIQGGTIKIDNTNVTLTPTTGGFFDNAGFSDLINRGYLLLLHK